MPVLAALWASVSASKALRYLGAGLLLVALCGALWARGNHYHGKWVHERDGRLADRSRYEAAEVQADAKARAQVAAVEAQSRSIAEGANHEAVQARADARAAVARYAGLHPVAGGPRCEPAATAQADAAAVHDGPRPVTDMVAISRGDLDQIADAAVRMAKVKELADRLIAAGLAVAEDAPPR